MYADDLVVFSPTSAGLQQLLAICSTYGVEHFQCNASKSLKYLDLNLSENNLTICNKVKYLGCYITEQMTDEDIYRQCRMMYGQSKHSHMQVQCMHRWSEDVFI